MKKRLTVLAILIIILLSLASCNGNGEDKAVQRIEVLPGSFKIDYKIDEQLDLSNAYMNIIYWDGNKEQKKITESMVTGFDTGKTINEGQLSVNYGGQSAKLFYTVGKNEVAVNTYARVLARREGNSIIISLKNLAEYGEGIYAATFTLSAPDTNIFKTFTALGAGGAASYEEKEDGIKILWYNANAQSVKQDTDIIKIDLNQTDGETVVISKIDISDGVHIIKLPSKSITV